jgi:hypothetical protein
MTLNTVKVLLLAAPTRKAVIPIVRVDAPAEAIVKVAVLVAVAADLAAAVIKYS